MAAIFLVFESSALRWPGSKVFIVRTGDPALAPGNVRQPEHFTCQNTVEHSAAYLLLA